MSTGAGPGGSRANPRTVEVGLIVLGAALALVGSIAVDVLKTLRAGRAAALTIGTELSENENRLSSWFSRAHQQIGMEPGDRLPDGKTVQALSAVQVRQLAAHRLKGDLPPFPRQVRAAWESQAVTFGQIANALQMMEVATFYIYATDAEADTIACATLETFVRTARRASGEVVHLTLAAWAIRSVRESRRKWRLWRQQRQAAAD